MAEEGKTDTSGTDAAAQAAAQATEAAKQAAGETASKAALDNEVARRTAAEKELADMAQEVLSAVPEHLKPLIPEDLSPAQKVAWFRKAKETGLFAKQQAKVPETDGGKKPGTSPAGQDDSKLPRVRRMANAYGKTA